MGLCRMLSGKQEVINELDIFIKVIDLYTAILVHLTEVCGNLSFWVSETYKAKSTNCSYYSKEKK